MIWVDDGVVYGIFKSFAFENTIKAKLSLLHMYHKDCKIVNN